MMGSRRGWRHPAVFMTRLLVFVVCIAMGGPVVAAPKLLIAPKVVVLPADEGSITGNSGECEHITFKCDEDQGVTVKVYLDVTDTAAAYQAAGKAIKSFRGRKLVDVSTLKGAKLPFDKLFNATFDAKAPGNNQFIEAISDLNLTVDGTYNSDGTAFLSVAAIVQVINAFRKDVTDFVDVGGVIGFVADHVGFVEKLIDKIFEKATSKWTASFLAMAKAGDSAVYDRIKQECSKMGLTLPWNTAGGSPQIQPNAGAGFPAGMPTPGQSAGGSGGAVTIDIPIKQLAADVNYDIPAGTNPKWKPFSLTYNDEYEVVQSTYDDAKSCQIVDGDPYSLLAGGGWYSDLTGRAGTGPGEVTITDLTTTIRWDESGIETPAPGDTTMAAPGSAIQHEFLVPTKPHHYKCRATVQIKYSFDLHWFWTEAHKVSITGPSVLAGIQLVDMDDYAVALSGTTERTSDGGADGGRDGLFYVEVKDKTPAVFAWLTSQSVIPQAGTSGDKLANQTFDVVFRVIDNNPFPENSDIPNVDFYYTVAVTDYVSGNYSVPGSRNPLWEKLKFAAYRDKFVWKHKTGSASRVGAPEVCGGDPALRVAGPVFEPIPDVGGKDVVNGPLSLSITTYRSTFTVDDKMGYHYCKDSRACEDVPTGGKLYEFHPGRLKFFVVPRADASENSSFDGFPVPADNDTGYGADAGDADNAGSAVVTRFDGTKKGEHRPVENYDALVDTEIDGLTAVPAKGIGNIGRYGTEIADNDPPNLFVAIKDTRTNKIHIYGDNTTTLDSGTAPFTGAAGGGTRATTDNGHLRQENKSPIVFATGETPDLSGYEAFQAKCAPFDYFFHNHPDDADAFWVDEDTRLEFSTWGYDNINTFDNHWGLSAGNPAPDPLRAGWRNQQLSLGEFKITDGPGHNDITSFVPLYIFRDPNRPSSLNSGDCSIVAKCDDGRGNNRELRINAFVIWNKKEIRGMEEKKSRGP